MKSVIFAIIAVIVMIIIINVARADSSEVVEDPVIVVGEDIPLAVDIAVPGWCAAGEYCDGTLVDPVDASVGSVICGQGNKQQECTAAGDDLPPVWKSIDEPCYDDMSGVCALTMGPVVDDTQHCTGGLYCDGDTVPDEYAFVGADPICGPGGYKYSCVMSLGTPRWRTDREQCDTGMIGKC